MIGSFRYETIASFIRDSVACAFRYETSRLVQLDSITMSGTAKMEARIVVERLRQPYAQDSTGSEQSSRRHFI